MVVPGDSVVVGRLGLLRQGGEGGPAWVDVDVLVPRVVLHPNAAVGAQTEAVLTAHGLERQCGHHRVPEQRLEVDLGVDDDVLLGLIVLVSFVVSVVMGSTLPVNHDI